jgi:hypothetical protein
MLMKAHITITNDDGTVLEGDVALVLGGAGRVSRKVGNTRAKVRTVSNPTSAKLDFGKSERAFIKAYAKGLSGTRKFVLLVAYTAKGQVGKEVELNDVSKRWNKMTALLGGKFNRFFSNTAKDDGWVDTRKKGTYVLTSSWKDALE